MDKAIQAPTGSGKTAWAACMGQDHNAPGDYGLPFADWRPGQQEALEWIKEGDMKGSTIALCHTKALQDENYEVLGFDVLKGKSNYPCRHPQALGSATAADCRYSSSMYKCEIAGSCQYIAQKALCKQSSKVSMNYHVYLALASHWPPPNVLYLDEAQRLPGIVLDRAGTVVDFKTWQEWNSRARQWGRPYIPPFPLIKPSQNGGVIGQESSTDKASEWLKKARHALRECWTHLNKTGQDREALKLKRQCEWLGRKLTATIQAIESHPGDWWIKSGPRAKKFKGKPQPAFICKPLTARHHAPGYFGFNTLANRALMSATIGDFDTFAARLGIRDLKDYTVPHVWPASSRPIVDLDCPPMGAGAVRKNPQYKGMQADNIAEFVKKYPDDLGLIHVTSKRKGYDLAQALGARGLGSRTWVTPETGTEHQAAAWRRESGRRKDLITIAWSWWAGMDMGEVGVNIVAGIPWAYLGDEYERAKMQYDKNAFDQDAAYGVEQAAGRNRRGEDWQYMGNGNRGNLVAIADGNWGRLKRHYSQAFLESVV